MRRRAKPPEDPPPLERAEVARLIAEIAEHAGEWHTTPAGRAALDDLCELVGSPMVAYFVTSALGHPDGPRPLDATVDHIMEFAPRWAAQSERLGPDRRGAR